MGEKRVGGNASGETVKLARIRQQIGDSSVMETREGVVSSV